MLPQRSFYRLKKAYIIFFISIILLLIGQWAFNQLRLNQQIGDSKLINLSGRQRMLSQKIAKILLLLERDNTIESVRDNIRKLKNDFAIWDHQHDNFRKGIINNRLTFEFSVKAWQLFERLDKEQRAIYKSITHILNSDRVNSGGISLTLKENIEEVLKREKNFLSIMDELVLQFDLEAAQKLESFKILQHLLLVLILIIIILQFFRVFSPTAKKLFSALKQLEDSETKYKELSQTKDKLFSIISHDLRGPMGTLVNFFDYALDKIPENSGEENQKMFHIMGESLGQVQTLLENLLQWASSQSGMIAYDPVYFPLKKLCKEIEALFRKRALEKEINLDIDVEDGDVFGDYHMIAIVLRNLVSNALKFTSQKGRIRIEVKREEKEALCRVRDTGVGMSEEGLAKVFRIDDRYSTRGTDNEPGTGLGLVLCKDFVEKNGGKIWVESTLGSGTCFSFTLPLGPSEGEAAGFLGTPE